LLKMGEDSPAEPSEGHVDRVIERLLLHDRATMMDWTQSRETTLADHIDHVFAMSGVEDHAGRADAVQRAIEEQEKFMKEKKARKSVKLVRAAQKALELQRKAGGFNRAQALAAAAFVEVSELKTNWSLVHSFRSQEDALRFIFQCQAFQYRPSGPEDFPRFQNREDAIAYVMAMDPLPEEFVCVEPLFKRRLRMRQAAAPKETKAEIAQQRAKATERILIGHRPAEPAPQERPWLIEAAGNIFESTPVRSLSETTSQRLFLAVAPELEKKVLTEGWVPGKRSSVPCYATQKEALKAYLQVMRRNKEEREQAEKRKEQHRTQNEEGNNIWNNSSWTSAHELFPVLSEDKQDFKAAVLAVSVPAELGHRLVTNRDGGFLIRTDGKALPATCFSRVKRSNDA